MKATRSWVSDRVRSTGKMSRCTWASVSGRLPMTGSSRTAASRVRPGAIASNGFSSSATMPSIRTTSRFAACTVSLAEAAASASDRTAADSDCTAAGRACRASVCACRTASTPVTTLSMPGIFATPRPYG